MADTLLFRGGSTADIDLAGTTVNDREIVIDTETNQIVLGSAKDRTVMQDSSGDVELSGNLELTNSTIDLYSQTTDATSRTFQLFSDIGGAKTEQVVFLADGAGIFAGGQAVINSAGVLDIQSTTAAADVSTLFRCGSANVTGGANAFVVTANGGGTFVGDVKIGGTLPSSPNISLSSGGAGTFTGYIASDRGPNDALPCFVARKNGTDNAYIYNDGSAKFKGAVTVDRAAGACLEIKQAGVSKIYLDSSGYVGIGGTPGDPALTNIKFESNGNATFSGNVTAANIGAFKSSLTAAATSATTLADLKTAIINALANL